ncbi:MAG: hypothetical protein ACHP7P_11195 [Terriglobales bacterium]
MAEGRTKNLDVQATRYTSFKQFCEKFYKKAEGQANEENGPGASFGSKLAKEVVRQNTK